MGDLVLSESLFRRACGQFATGVGIATVMDEAGNPHGLTVNSFTSVSLAPPLLLFCIDYRAAILPAFLAAACYGISILRHDQVEISNRFATRADKRFDGIGWYAGPVGAPLIEGAIAVVECTRYQTIEAGDHTIFLVEAKQAALSEGEPLLYFQGSYQQLSRTES